VAEDPQRPHCPFAGTLEAVRFVERVGGGPLPGRVQDDALVSLLAAEALRRPQECAGDALPAAPGADPHPPQTGGR
jgi:hypothetical protein